jgi:hypothetical protein
MTTFILNGEQHPFPQGKWKDRTPVEVYDDFLELKNEVADIDEEENQLPVLLKNGFQSAEHFEAYSDYIINNMDFVAYGQMKMNEGRQKLTEQAAALSGTEVMAPIAGISLELYAQMNAQFAQGKDFQTLLKEKGIEMVSWEKASAGWMERMRTDTTFTVSNEYSKHFMGAGQGQFGATAKEAANVQSGNGATTQSVAPVSIERYAEIAAAMNAAAGQGKDAMQVLASYGLNGADWGTVGIYWSNKMMGAATVGTKFSELYNQYTEQFSAAAPKVADDIDF